MSRRCDLTNKGAQFGNKVSHAQNKSRRRFNVNVQNVSFRSEALNKVFKLKVAASTIRSVDHNGGLDSYLLTTSNNKLSDEAVKIKRQIKKISLAQTA